MKSGWTINTLKITAGGLFVFTDPYQCRVAEKNLQKEEREDVSY